jgi:YbbR domain-containing protein
MGVAALLKRAFWDNAGLKALSLAFSVGLFAYIHSKEDVQQRTVPVSVIVLNPVDSARELMTQLPPSVHVTLRGTARAIDSVIKAGGLAPVEIDLRDGDKDMVTFDESMFSVPPSIDITIIDPPRIELEWQQIITRQIPLQASITGQPAEGYVVKGEPTVEPNKIGVRGPVSLVEVMQFARLAAFDVTGLTAGVFPRRVAIDAPPNRISYIGPQRATVSVTIARRTSERKFDSRPVEVIGIAQAVVSPRTVDVTVIGPPEVVRALKDAQVIPRADLNQVSGLNLKEQHHGSARVALDVDIGRAEVEVQPPVVMVRW